MAFVPAPNGAVAALRGELNGQAVVNTLWFSGTVPYTQPLCELLAGELADLWRDMLKPIQVPTYTLNEVQVYAMEAATSPTGTVTVGESGGGSGEAAANQAALVVTFRTGGRGRWSRGRNYLTGFSEAHLSNNAWTATPIGAAANFFGNLSTYVNGVNGSIHVVASRKLNGFDREVALMQTVLSYEPQALPGTIRQRTGR